jgi:hypothetical protein
MQVDWARSPLRNEVKQCQGPQAGQACGCRQSDKAGAMRTTVECYPANSGERPKALVVRPLQV